jgi:hypothetical protein
LQEAVFSHSQVQVSGIVGSKSMENRKAMNIGKNAVGTVPINGDIQGIQG